MFDAGTLGVISTLLMVPAIIGIAWWAFAPRRKKRFEDAANLPFADEAEQKPTDSQTNGQSTDSGEDTEKRN